MKKPPRENIFSDSCLDRATLLRADSEALATRRKNESARFLLMRGTKHVVDASGKSPRPRFFRYDEIAAYILRNESIFLGTRDGIDYFTAEVVDGYQPENTALSELRPLVLLFNEADASLYAYSRAMLFWHQRHLFCGSCAAPTIFAAGGHERTCSNSDCKTETIFPRIDPAIIVLVTHEDRCLLGRHRKWKHNRFSTIAGFVEPGESIEQAVRREVHEETGVEVAAVSFHSSQPWPFPSSLMIGFTAEACSETITLHDGELAEARWFTREDLLKGLCSGELFVSARLSIAYRLVSNWYRSDVQFSIEELEQLVDKH